MKHFLLALSMFLNQSVNVLTGGHPGMSVSARAAYAREAGSSIGTCFCALLEFADPHWVTPHNVLPGDHCDIAMANHIAGLQP